MFDGKLFHAMGSATQNAQWQWWLTICSNMFSTMRITSYTCYSQITRGNGSGDGAAALPASFFGSRNGTRNYFGAFSGLSDENTVDENF